MGAYLDSKLDTLREKHSIITSTRGLGLMRAFEMAEPRAQDMMDLALKRGVLILNAGPATIRFVPPLIIQQAEIDEAIDHLDAALASL
jgi:acetylornithine/N-succinyldiaminopimelate aminotransferase